MAPVQEDRRVLPGARDRAGLQAEIDAAPLEFHALAVVHDAMCHDRSPVSQKPVFIWV
jgi:hypothetical protein